MKRGGKASSRLPSKRRRAQDDPENESECETEKDLSNSTKGKKSSEPTNMDLMNYMKRMDSKMDEVKGTVEEIKTSVSQLKVKVSDLESRVSDIEENVQPNNFRILALTKELEKLEIKTRKLNLIIVGFDEPRNEKDS